MDSTILAGIIGGISTVVAALIAALVTIRLNRPSTYISSDRRAMLRGEWEGTAHEETPQSAPLDYKITGHVTATSRVVRAEATLRARNRQNQEFIDHLDLTGGFIFDRFLKLEYKTRDKPGSMQFGFLILELEPTGNTLKGYFLSYGPQAQSLLSGSVHLVKIK